MKRFGKIGALVMASMITGVVLSGCGNNSNANGGSQVENPFAQNSITVSEGSQTASDASQTESVDNPSVPQTSASSDTAPQSSLSAEPSIREVMDASGGVSALSGMFESFTPESMTVSAGYGTDDQIVIKMKIEQMIDVDSDQGRELIEKMNTQIGSTTASLSKGITTIRTAYHCRPFTFVVQVLNADDSVIFQKEIAEGDVNPTPSAEPSAESSVTEVSQDTSPEPSAPVSVSSQPQTEQMSLRQMIEMGGGLSALESILTQQLGDDQFNVKTEFNGDDQVVVIMQLKQYVDMNSSQGKQMLGQVQSNLSEMGDSVSESIEQIQEEYNVRPFTYKFSLRNAPGTVLFEVVVSADGIEQ